MGKWQSLSQPQSRQPSKQQRSITVCIIYNRAGLQEPVWLRATALFCCDVIGSLVKGKTCWSAGTNRENKPATDPPSNQHCFNIGQKLGISFPLIFIRISNKLCIIIVSLHPGLSSMRAVPFLNKISNGNHWSAKDRLVVCSLTCVLYDNILYY